MPDLRSIHTGKFRVMSRAIFSNKNKIFVIRGRSSTKEERFFVLPGGTVEFGETSKRTLVREMREEFSTKLKNIKYLGSIENLFSWKGKEHHEIAFIYSASFASRSFYKRSLIAGIEDTGEKIVGEWRKISEFKNGKETLVPVGILSLLGGKSSKEKHYPK